MSFRLKFDLKPQQNKNNNEYFYYNKKKHYTKDCNKQKSEKNDINNQEAKWAYWEKIQNNQKATLI